MPGIWRDNLEFNGGLLPIQLACGIQYCSSTYLLH